MAQPKPYNDFQLLVRAFNQYIKSYHHLQHTNCGVNTPTPIGLRRIQDQLTSAVYPAFPSKQTSALTYGNAANWTYTTLQILEEHHRARMQEAICKIQELSKEDWERALTVATRWVSKDIPRMKPTTLKDATTELRTLITGPSQREINQEETVNSSPQPNRVTRSPAPPPTQIQGSNHETAEPNAQIHTDIQPVLGNINDNPEESTIQTSEDHHHVTNNPATDTVMFSDGESDSNSEKSHSIPPLPTPGRHTTTASPDVRKQSTPRVQPIYPSGTHLYKYHTHDGDKNKNWNLTPNRSILIIGDSNIARLPVIPDDRIQVDSYPGANLSQATYLLKHNTPNSNNVTKVILSFGINNRNQRLSIAFKKDLSDLLKTAKTTFPQAEIFIPVLNYSDNLPGNVRSHINTLNYHIKGTGRSIPRLEKDSFNTDVDNIHWTSRTAERMWDHWRTFLG